MRVTALSLRLQEKLGPEAADDLAGALETTKQNMLITSQDRFEMRLATVAAELRGDMARLDAGLRNDMANMDVRLRDVFVDGLARVRGEIHDSKVEMLRW